MEDEFNYTALADDTVALDSPIAESQLLNLDKNTEVLDVCEYAQDSEDQTEDYCKREIVLDSDDEGREQNVARNLVNGKCFPVIGRFSGSDRMGLLKRRHVPSGYFRRLDSKFSEHVFLHQARSDGSDRESNARRTCLCNDSRFQEHPVVVDSEVSRSPPDQKLIPKNAKEYQVDPEYINMVKENLREDSFDEKKLSLDESKSIDMGKNENYDRERELNYVESPEPTESHTKALAFVDYYLSVSNLGSYKDAETRKVNRTKSPPSLRSKGFQTLARRVNLGCTTSKTTTFDWNDEKQIEKVERTSPRMNRDSFFGFECDKSGYVSVDKESDIVNLPKEISSVQSKDKLPQNTLTTKDLNTKSLNSDEIDKVGSNSGICIAYDSMELNEQFDAGLPSQNVQKVEQLRLMPDVLDIGLDTQMAAEAMEALVHAAPPMFDVCSSHQVSDDTPLDSSSTANEKSKPKYVAKHEEAFVGWRCKQQRSKCVKISTVQDKNISFSAAKQLKTRRGAVAQLSVNENLMTRKNLGSRTPENTKISKCGGTTGIAVQQEEYRYTKKDSLEEFQKVHCLNRRRSKQTIDGAKSDSHLKRRKMISRDHGLCQKGVGFTCLKLNSDSSFEVKTDMAKREEKSDQDVADRTQPKLNMWNYPKGKRSRQYALLHSTRSNKQCSPCTGENNVERYPILNEEAQKRAANLLVYTRRRNFSLEREQMGRFLELPGDLGSPSVNDNAISDRQVPIEFDQAKPSMQCRKLADVKSDGLSIGQVFQGCDKSKQPFNHLSRSPLMKELMRLGYTDSVPDFLPKDSRRRRSMEKVCILFSQNLEISILKQQKKIVARLGFSISSCCSDATHFVTDRFVRTRNMLEAVALGKPVVTHLWLESCEQAGYVIDEKSYILRDEKKEKEIGFNMPVSLARASQRPLLKGRRVFVTPNVKPGIDVINSLVKAVQGQAVQNIPNSKMKDKVILDDLLIVSCEDDYTMCFPFLEKGASIYDSELLLNGIITQKLEYERYQLFKDFIKSSS